MMPIPESDAGRFHVAGILVQAEPRAARSVGQRIGQVPGAVVHAMTDGGKLVVTLESEDVAYIAEQLALVQHMDGVLSAVLVSEHSEPLDAADEELLDAPAHENAP